MYTESPPTCCACCLPAMHATFLLSHRETTTYGEVPSTLQIDTKFGSRCCDLTKMLVFKDGGGGVVQLCMMWVCARCGKVFYLARLYMRIKVL